jgi:plasmid stabilization system protein ParE
MRVRWTRPAINELAAIVHSIRKDKPEAAARVTARIAATLATLDSMEQRGRAGPAKGTKEIVFHPWPYIGVYEIVRDEVRVLHIRHAAQQWPTQDDFLQ